MSDKNLKNQERMAKMPKKTTNKKTTRIGKAEYINRETGLIEQFNVIEEHDQDFNFQKIWLGHLLESLDVLGNAKIKVLNYLLANKNRDNQIIGTQRAIAEGVGVSLPVVNATIKKLKEVNAIKKVSSGVLMLNPGVVFQGGHSKRMNILLKYTNTETIDQEIGEEQQEMEFKD